MRHLKQSLRSIFSFIVFAIFRNSMRFFFPIYFQDSARNYQLASENPMRNTFINQKFCIYIIQRDHLCLTQKCNCILHHPYVNHILNNHSNLIHMHNLNTISLKLIKYNYKQNFINYRRKSMRKIVQMNAN